MDSTYIEDQKFVKEDFSGKTMSDNIYEACSFINCNFEKAILANVNFSECVFTGCNISMANLGKATLNDVRFINCKLLGLHFEDCSNFLFTVYFDNCRLHLCSFFQRDLKKTTFKQCEVREVDFTEANLTGSVFDNCDLSLAVFENSVLEKVDFRTAFNYNINPETNRVKKAKFSTAGLAGLLYKYDIDIS